MHVPYVPTGYPIRPHQASHTTSATMLSRARAPPLLSPLERLHPELQREIGAYLRTQDAIQGVSSAARACRSHFPAGITTRLVVRATPVLEEAPGTTDETHAASLARLLALLPAIQSIQLPPNHERMNRIFGLACCLLPAPLAHLAELKGSDSNDGPTPHPLAQALALGRSPFLRFLDTSHAGWQFFSWPLNAALLGQAIQHGHLARLVRLTMEEEGALAAVAQALTPGSHQPVLPHLDTLVLSFYPSWRSPYPPPDLSVLEHVLGPDGGAPNLRELVVGNTNRYDLAYVGAIYATGGLARLETLRLADPALMIDYDLVGGMAALLAGAGASPHRGEALEVIDIRFNRWAFHGGEEQQLVDTWHTQLAAAQAQGIFPNAEQVDNLSWVEEYDL